MKITAKTIISGILLFAVLSTVWAYEKATIYYKNGDKKDCIIDQYEIGKWVTVVDETGVKNTIKWDVINVVLFKNEEVTQNEIAQSAEPAVTDKSETEVPPAAIEAIPVSDAPKTDAVPMNFAQKLAQKEKERKEKEAMAANPAATNKDVKKTEPKAVTENIITPPAKPVQPSDQREKATVYYKNGDVLKCTIGRYEMGKYAEVFDENGGKRIISWDSINEIIFMWAEDAPKSQAAKQTQELPATPPSAAAPSAAPTGAEGVVVLESAGSKSMLDQFNKDKTPKSDRVEPVMTKEEQFKQDIREENKGQKPVFDFDKDSKKLSVDYYKTLESDATRRCWLEEGGKLLSKGYTVNYTYVSMDMSDDMPEGESEFSMHGLGYTGNMYLKFLNPPNYDMGKSSWTSMSLGFTGSFNINFGGMEYSASGYNYTMDMTMASFELSVPLGYTFGVGQYLSRSDWKGVMIGIYWKPSFQFNSVTTTMDMDPDPWGMFPMTSDPTTDSSVNLSGLQWTIDYGSFSGMAEDLAQEAHFSISGFILPETDSTPFMFSIGLGMIWY